MANLDIATILDDFEELISIMAKKNKIIYNFVEVEELQQIGRISILKACEKFNSNKGSLENFLYSCIKNDMLKYIQKNIQKNNIEQSVTDMNLDIKDNHNTLSELEYEATIKQTLLMIKDKKDKSILEQLLLENKTQKNIAENINCSQSTVSYRIKKCSAILQNDLRCFYG